MSIAKDGASVIIAAILWVVGISCALAGLFALNASLAAKVVIAAFAILLWVVLQLLLLLHKTLVRLLYFVRCNYIANETQRLDPGNVVPAREILASDRQHEIELEEGYKSIFPVFQYSIIIWGALGFLVVICTSLFYELFR